MNNIMKTLLCPVVFSVMASQFALAGGDTGINIEDYASLDLSGKCDSLRLQFQSKPDSIELYEHAELVLKDERSINVKGQSFCAIIIGCTGFGELILLDSSDDRQVQFRQALTIPGKHVNIEDVLDINSDGFDEIILNLSAGAHGYYSYFISVHKDSLSFITDERGNYGFFAMRGGVFVKDIDNDGTQEIIVDHMLKSGQRENYTIYKWNGKNYFIHDRVER